MITSERVGEVLSQEVRTLILDTSIDVSYSLEDYDRIEIRINGHTIKRLGPFQAQRMGIGITYQPKTH